MFHSKKYFFILFLIFSFGLKNFLLAVPSDTTKTNNRAIKNSSGFKEGSGSIIKTSKWLFPIITIASGISYFYFDNQATRYYKDYQNANSPNEAIDLRAKTKSSDQSATISGITALSAAAVSILVWIYDNKTKSEEFNIGEEYKFTLNSGRQLTGHLAREDFDSLLIQTKEGAITVKRSDISRIEKDGLVIYEK